MLASPLVLCYKSEDTRPIYLLLLRWIELFIIFIGTMLCELVPPLKLAIKEREAPRILWDVTVVTVFTCIVFDETFE